MTLKPFNLEAALRCEKVVMRNGEKVSKVFYVPDSVLQSERIVCVSNGFISYRYATGKIFGNSTNTPFDLFMAPQTREGWINIYPPEDNTYTAAVSDAHATKEIADNSCNPHRRLACIRIEWEE